MFWSPIICFDSTIIGDQNIQYLCHFKADLRAINKELHSTSFLRAAVMNFRLVNPPRHGQTTTFGVVFFSVNASFLYEGLELIN